MWAGCCCCHRDPSHVHVSWKSWAWPMPAGPAPPNKTISWCSESYAAISAPRAGGPETSSCSHAFPSQSQVSATARPRLVPSGSCITSLPPNRITPWFSGSYTIAPPDAGVARVVTGELTGEAEGDGGGLVAIAAVRVCRACGLNTKLPARAPSAITARAPMPKPRTSACLRVTEDTNVNSRLELRPRLPLLFVQELLVEPVRLLFSAV